MESLDRGQLVQARATRRRSAVSTREIVRDRELRNGLARPPFSIANAGFRSERERSSRAGPARAALE
jgi:hypothetical protein